ncbi:MAG: mannose-6-phosphate isomerase, class I [Deltaproteobacteria bacterium]|nr:MAG: mannose-6-phosphate isomerase, class I [Deltaproteobacteria bacterium]
MDLKRPLRLKNKIQEYEWGSKTAIPSILGLPSPSKKPMAELWMGAHPKAPSEVEVDGKWMRLDELISIEPKAILGKKVADKFGNQLPFLFKIIAAEKPLSIQAHPNKEQAINGFERENKLGIPLDAPERNYKDKNHKPEVLCAITRFEALKGFRSIEEIVSLFKKAVPNSLKEEINLLEREGLRSFFSAIMGLKAEKKEDAISELLNSSEKMKNDPVFSLVLRLNNYFPKDIGIFSPLILNMYVLEPGEAIFLPAGELHAYIKGVGIELMANSDNVLRGGLTHKHIDVEELLNILRFEPSRVQKLKPVSVGKMELIYPAPVEEFILHKIRLKEGEKFSSDEDRSIEIMIVIEGNAEISSATAKYMELKRGDSVLIPSVMPKYFLKGDATIYKATVPSQSQ